MLTVKQNKVILSDEEELYVEAEDSRHYIHITVSDGIIHVTAGGDVIGTASYLDANGGLQLDEVGVIDPVKVVNARTFSFALPRNQA